MEVLIIGRQMHNYDCRIKSGSKCDVSSAIEERVCDSKTKQISRSFRTMNAQSIVNQDGQSLWIGISGRIHQERRRFGFTRLLRTAECDVANKRDTKTMEILAIVIESTWLGSDQQTISAANTPEWLSKETHLKDVVMSLGLPIGPYMEHWSHFEQSNVTLFCRKSSLVTIMKETSRHPWEKCTCP